MQNEVSHVVCQIIGLIVRDAGSPECLINLTFQDLLRTLLDQAQSLQWYNYTVFTKHCLIKVFIYAAVIHHTISYC